MQRLLTIVRLTRPLYLLLAAVTYVLGTGIARYLGHPQVPTVFWLGLVGVLLAQASMSLLVDVFRPANEPIVQGESASERKSVYDAALYVSIGFLAAASFVAVLLFKDGHLSPAAMFVLSFALV